MVDNQLGLGAVLHQPAGSTRMIKVNMGGHDITYGIRRESQLANNFQ